MKILDFFLFLWVIFALPDPATQINADPETDPDPKPCMNAVLWISIRMDSHCPKRLDPDPHRN